MLNEIGSCKGRLIIYVFVFWIFMDVNIKNESMDEKNNVLILVFCFFLEERRECEREIWVVIFCVCVCFVYVYMYICLCLWYICFGNIYMW